jgi:hypothetical protein
MDPQQTIDQVIEDAQEFRIKFVGVETIAYQQTLKFWMEKAIAKLGLDITIIDLKPQQRFKTTRIVNWIKSLLIGDYSLHAEARAQVLFQGLAFKKHRTDNKDDILDDGAYGLDIREEYHDQIMHYGSMTTQVSTQKARVMANNSCLDRRR